VDSTIVCLKLYSLLSVLKITGFFEITLSEISRDLSFCLIITAAEEKNAYNGSLETVANNQSISPVDSSSSQLLQLDSLLVHFCVSRL
jgi:hypothetical protein